MTDETVMRVDPEIMSDTPWSAHTRFPVGVLFKNLADGCTLDEILEDWRSRRRRKVIEDTTRRLSEN